MKSTFFTIAIISFLFTLNLKAQEATPAPVSKAKINFKTLEHDFGKINENDGPVTFKFDLTNDVTSNADQPSVVLTIKGEVIPAPAELPANPEPQK